MGSQWIRSSGPGSHQRTAQCLWWKQHWLSGRRRRTGWCGCSFWCSGTFWKKPKQTEKMKSHKPVKQMEWTQSEEGNSLLYIVPHCPPTCYVTFSEEFILHSCLYRQSMNNQINNLKNYSDPAGIDRTSCPTAVSFFLFVIFTANHCRAQGSFQRCLEPHSASGEGICSVLPYLAFIGSPHLGGFW